VRRGILLFAVISVWLAAGSPLAAQQAARLDPGAPWTSPSPPRHLGPLATVPDSIRRKSGYQYWKGAAIGGALGALGGPSLALLAHGQCSDCPSDTPHIGQVTLIGAALGGAFGFLVGLASPRYRWVAGEPE
jgi:hypothetical protein